MATKYIDILTTIDRTGYAHKDVLDGAESTLTIYPVQQYRTGYFYMTRNNYFNS